MSTQQTQIEEPAIVIQTKVAIRRTDMVSAVAQRIRQGASFQESRPGLWTVVREHLHQEGANFLMNSPQDPGTEALQQAGTIVDRYFPELAEDK